MSGEEFYYDKYERNSVGGGHGLIIDLSLMFLIWAIIQLFIDNAWVMNVKGAKMDFNNTFINVMHAVLLPILSLYQILTVDHECTK